MKTRVRKWGHSLAVRIPKLYADQMGLTAGTRVTISLDGRRLVIEPVRAQTLDDLLADVTPDNVHGETDWGRAAGREGW